MWYHEDHSTDCIYRGLALRDSSFKDKEQALNNCTNDHLITIIVRAVKEKSK